MNYNYFSNGEPDPRGLIRVARVYNLRGELLFTPAIYGAHCVEDEMFDDKSGLQRTLTNSDEANRRIFDWAKRKGFRLVKID